MMLERRLEHSTSLNDLQRLNSSFMVERRKRSMSDELRKWVFDTTGCFALHETHACNMDGPLLLPQDAAEQILSTAVAVDTSFRSPQLSEWLLNQGSIPSAITGEPWEKEPACNMIDLAICEGPNGNIDCKVVEIQSGPLRFVSFRHMADWWAEQMNIKNHVDTKIIDRNIFNFVTKGGIFSPEETALMAFEGATSIQGEDLLMLRKMLLDTARRRALISEESARDKNPLTQPFGIVNQGSLRSGALFDKEKQMFVWHSGAAIRQIRNIFSASVTHFDLERFGPDNPWQDNPFVKRSSGQSRAADAELGWDTGLDVRVVPSPTRMLLFTKQALGFLSQIPEVSDHFVKQVDVTQDNSSLLSQLNLSAMVLKNVQGRMSNDIVFSPTVENVEEALRNNPSGWVLQAKIPFASIAQAPDGTHVTAEMRVATIPVFDSAGATVDIVPFIVYARLTPQGESHDARHMNKPFCGFTPVIII